MLHPALQTTALLATIVAAYWWLHIPAVDYYTLQVFALCIAIYFLLKRLSKAKLWHIVPRSRSVEMALVTFAFLLVLGDTGNLSSPFFPLTYIHLFFLVFATHPLTSIITTLAVMVFHIAVGSNDLTVDGMHLLSLPIMTFFFLFAKHQYDELLKERMILKEEEKELLSIEKQTSNMNTFLSQFVLPKLDQVEQLTAYAQQNKDVIIGQLELIKLEIQKRIPKS